MRKIIKNAIQCKLCGDVIESTDRRQYVTCKCGACAVDGGHDYLRRSYKDKDCYTDLLVTVPLTEYRAFECTVSSNDNISGYFLRNIGRYRGNKISLLRL